MEKVEESSATLPQEYEQEEIDPEDPPELEFNVEKESGALGFIFVCVLVVLILASLAKLALNLSLQKQNISIPPSDFSHQPNYQPQSRRNSLAGTTSSAIVLDALSQDFAEISLDEVPFEESVKAEQLNANHVSFRKSLRKSDLQIAKLRLTGLEDDYVSEDSEITYKQFMTALGLLQLTTLRPPDIEAQVYTLSAEEREIFDRKWSLREEESNICVLMLLTAQGLNTGNYYYALRSLFQQKYHNLKIVIVDNTPALGLQAHILGLIAELGKGRQIVLLDRTKREGAQGSSIYYALHKYCVSSDIFILLRDNGQLIGEHAFSLLNSIHTNQQASLVTSHYLLDMGSPFTQSQDFRYRIQLYEKKYFSAQARKSIYKTKYLKSYSSQLLFGLPLELFHNQNGYWLDSSFESVLEFASLERACGRHFILPQILYRIPQSELESNEAVLNARRQTTLSCQEQPYQLQMNLDMSRQFSQFDNKLVEVVEVQEFSAEEERNINKELILHHRQRTKELKMGIVIEEQSLAREQNEGRRLQREEALVSLYELTMGYRANMYDNSNLDLPEEIDPLIDYDKKYLQSIKTLRKDKVYGAQKHYHMPHSENTSEIVPLDSHEESSYFCLLLMIDGNQTDFNYFYSIESVLKQEYSSYRLVIIANGSPDSTIKVIKRHILKIPSFQSKRVHFYSSKWSLPVGQVLYFGIRKFCQPGEVLLVMDAGQELIGNNVLESLNEQYRHKDTLATHTKGLFLEGSMWSMGNSERYDKYVLKQKAFRQHPLYFGPLRSCKVQVFLRLEVEDFKFEKEWSSSSQVWFSLSYGILELSCNGLVFLNLILYRMSELAPLEPSSPAPPPTESQNTTGEKTEAVRTVGFKYNCFRESVLSVDP